MEDMSEKRIRVFRSKEEILNILSEYGKSEVNVKTFCVANNIAAATFHNWKKKYSDAIVRPVKQQGFTALQVTPSMQFSETVLFAEVKGIRIYQRVDAGYLKELLA